MAEPAAHRRVGPGGRARPGRPRKDPGPTGPDEVRRAVLDAAAALFAEHGVPRVTLRRIADEARVNVALIPRYVGTREQLIEAVFDDLSDQLAAEVDAEPLGQRGFEPDTTMVRWTRVLLYLVLTGSDVPAEHGFRPAAALARAMSDNYGLDTRSAELRAAQVMASALGWRIFERYLAGTIGLPDVTVQDLRDELTETHRRLGRTAWQGAERPEEEATTADPTTRA